jgi:TonB family protein
MTSNFIPALAAISITLLCSCISPCNAQSIPEPPATTGGERFQLSATMSNSGQLSRAEIDKSSLGMGSLPTARQPQRGAPLIATAPPRNVPPTNLKQDDTPGAFMQEYNIDWSSWVGTEADHWFYILRSAETGLGIRFDCPRAALIQFTCYADGSIGNIILKQSSGVPAYDQLQIEALRATQPTAPFPPGTVRKSITLIQGWESHKKKPGELDFQPGSFGKNFPAEVVRQWLQAH